VTTPGKQCARHSAQATLLIGITLGKQQISDLKILGSSTGTAFWKLLRLFNGLFFLQCFDAVGWVAGRASGL